jgi:serine/threonine-protein kinase
MPEPPPEPPLLSSPDDGDESLPTAVDAAEGPPTEDNATFVDPKVRQSSADLEAELAALAGGDFDTRYELGDELGKGGMGEVRLAQDTRIGRTVALKLIREEGAKRSRLRARFLFEAKMQGQLEHPSIVPVYDLGMRPDGSAYFTMRRVRGRTLHEVLRGLRAGERPIAASFSRRRLLAAFQSVCLAVEFAHQRGVVHRDLKPSNIMLGEFGEVIVLDWGLAKLKDPKADQGRPSLGDTRSIDMTGVGEVLGSAGYMSPEQALDSQGVGTPADVFALGAILFEILTLNRLIEGDSNADVAGKTRIGEYDAHIGKRFPDLDVPPELEAICVRATDMDENMRQPRARDLADAVASYLEGDRDVARRRSMATQHTRAANAALGESVRAENPDQAKAARSRAIREVNHALAIDPSSQTALRTMMKIITEAPTRVAPDAEAAMRASEERALRTLARRGSYLYLALAAMIGLMGVLGVADALALGVAVGFILLAALASMAGAHAPARLFEPPRAHGAAPRSSAVRRITVGQVIITVILLSSCGIAASSMLFGPLVYVPTLASANVVVLAAGVGRRYRYFALACGLAAIVIPLALELADVVPPGWVYRDGTVAIMPRAVHFPGVSAMLLLALASLCAVLFPVLLVGAERDARVKAERELIKKERALAEFVPAEAGEALSGRRSMPPEPPKAEG